MRIIMRLLLLLLLNNKSMIQKVLFCFASATPSTFLLLLIFLFLFKSSNSSIFVAFIQYLVNYLCSFHPIFRIFTSMEIIDISIFMEINENCYIK